MCLFQIRKWLLVNANICATQCVKNKCQTSYLYKIAFKHISRAVNGYGAESPILVSYYMALLSCA